MKDFKRRENEVVDFTLLSFRIYKNSEMQCKIRMNCEPLKEFIWVHYYANMVKWKEK